jgi:hypothetical protein
VAVPLRHSAPSLSTDPMLERLSGAILTFLAVLALARPAAPQ